MKQIKIAVLTAAAIAFFSAVGINQIFNQAQDDDTLLLENIEALTLNETPDGKFIIEDHIPCASSANELKLHCSYVNCTTCRSEKGDAKGSNGQCTVIRIVDPKDI